MPNKKEREGDPMETTQVTVSMVFFQEHDKLLRENQELKIQVGNLTGQRDQLRELLAERDKTIEELKRENEELKLRITQLEKKIEEQEVKIEEQEVKIEEQAVKIEEQAVKIEEQAVKIEEQAVKIEEQAVKIEEQAVKIEKLEDQLDNVTTLQKFADSSKELFEHMYDLFCHNSSVIRRKSEDSDLYHLCDHLSEFHHKKYSRWSRVKQNLPLWDETYQIVITTLQTECNITDISVFFEVIRLRQERNGISHHSEKITLDELKDITPFAVQIWSCL
jgi:DNA repair exonuclease SbcCD ATPase subunit